MSWHVLVVRLDRPGDVLVCGPAVRAVAGHADRVTMLCSSAGAPAADLLPGVDDVLIWDCPWIANPAPPVRTADVLDVIRAVTAARVDEALILTSFHQSALPTALVLRMAGVEHIAAVSTDYAGDLLSMRLPEPPDAPEPVRMLAVAGAAGYPAASADVSLAVRPTGPCAVSPPFVVVHPGTDAPARAYPAGQWREVVRLLTATGRTVVVTGDRSERELTRLVASGAAPAGRCHDLGGRTTLTQLGAVLAAADVVAVGNTAPAHLAAAVGTPVVSLFAPVVSARRWAPHGERTVVLGDQQAACKDSRARHCPVPEHPCLTSVPPADVVAAVDRLSAGALAAAP